MVEKNHLQISVLPALVTAAIASASFSVWVRFRSGKFPSKRIILSHFSVYSAGSLVAGAFWLADAQRRKKEALARIFHSAEGKLCIEYKESGAPKLQQEEFDFATGINGEDAVRESFQRVS